MTSGKLRNFFRYFGPGFIVAATGVGIAYTVTGAFFMPFLAALLLYMNNQKHWLKQMRNGWLTNLLLLLNLLLFPALFLVELW